MTGIESNSFGPSSAARSRIGWRGMAEGRWRFWSGASERATSLAGWAGLDGPGARAEKGAPGEATRASRGCKAHPKMRGRPAASTDDDLRSTTTVAT